LCWVFFPLKVDKSTKQFTTNAFPLLKGLQKYFYLLRSFSPSILISRLLKKDLLTEEAFDGRSRFIFGQGDFHFFEKTN
jgi:hypothetical protein